MLKIKNSEQLPGVDGSLTGTGQEGNFWRHGIVLHCNRVVGFTWMYMIASAAFQYM